MGMPPSRQSSGSYMKPFMNGVKTYTVNESVDYKIDPIYENQQRQLSSNLNPFGVNSSQATNALVILQGVQMFASRSNVMLIAVGGVVS